MHHSKRIISPLKDLIDLTVQWLRVHKGNPGLYPNPFRTVQDVFRAAPTWPTRHQPSTVRGVSAGEVSCGKAHPAGICGTESRGLCHVTSAVMMISRASDTATVHFTLTFIAHLVPQADCACIQALHGIPGVFPTASSHTNNVVTKCNMSWKIMRCLPIPELEHKSSHHYLDKYSYDMFLSCRFSAILHV